MEKSTNTQLILSNSFKSLYAHSPVPAPNSNNVICLSLGIYSFINLRVWEDMFLMNDFKFFDYEQSPILFYLKYLLVLIAIALVIYIIFSFIRKVKNRKIKKGGK